MVENLLKLGTPFPLCNQLCSVSPSSRSLFMTSSINIHRSPAPAAATTSNQPSLVVFSGLAYSRVRRRGVPQLSSAGSRAIAPKPKRFLVFGYSIIEGEHPLWKDVSKPYRETIRAFLAYFQNQIIRRTNESFSFSNGSIGNFFFAGARIFFQSLDAAIFLFSRVSQIPTESLVLPVISTNDRLTLGCELWDGTIIRGQNEISHPTSGSLQLIDKVNSSALPSMIKRVFYMSSEGSNLLHEVFPTVNPSVLEQLRNVDCIIYGMGSLFTSICPSLVLLGVGEIISSRSCAKVPVESMHDPKVGIVYEPTSLIQALANLLTGSANTES
nr:maternal effect embryo arrest 18 [Tanacetum cinerariifolium]